MYTGVRVGEALALRWSDVNFTDKTVEVKKSAYLVRCDDNEEGDTHHYETEITTTKTPSGNRTIYLPQRALEMITLIRNKNCPEYMNESVFIKSVEDRTLILARSLTNHLKYIERVEGFNVKDMGVHGLRHTFATMLFAAKIDIKTVSVLLGHATVDITYNTYVHLVKEQQQCAMEALDNL
ncbi:hypothetical protein AGMMS49975_19410 [Clostridia bacterium]|nr:hypothetical protein AGMMS49975_19410 [Clostridia bacterium]